jgi:predicted enzyme related to lactoylglutathione lyase
MQSPTPDTWRVTGVGGVFFKARDPRALRAWYAAHLGLEADADGTIRFWSFGDKSESRVYTVWEPFRDDTRYFNPSTKHFMFNFRVVNLDSLLTDLRKQGANVHDKIETYPYGRFAWPMDLEGNKIELWEPTPGWKPISR